MGGISTEARFYKRAAGKNIGVQCLFQLYAECEHSVWNSYVRPATSNAESGSQSAVERLFGGAKIMKHPSLIAKKRSEFSAAMTVVAMLVVGIIAKLGVAAQLFQLIH